MKFTIIHPNKDETYQVAYDDHCILIKQGKNKVWISQSMAFWIVSLFKNHFLNRLIEFFDEMDREYPENPDEILREAGIDPEQGGSKILSTIKKLLKKEE